MTNCPNNYSPYHSPEKLIPVMILDALAGKPLTIYGNGSNLRDWPFVGHHAEALLTELKQGRIGHDYAIGGHKNAVILSWFRPFAPLSTIWPLPRWKALFQPDHLRSRSPDPRCPLCYRRIRSELGCRPPVTPEQGLRRTVQWYLDNPDCCQPMPGRSGADSRLRVAS